MSKMTLTVFIALLSLMTLADSDSTGLSAYKVIQDAVRLDCASRQSDPVAITACTHKYMNGLVNEAAVTDKAKQEALRKNRWIASNKAQSTKPAQSKQRSVTSTRQSTPVNHQIRFSRDNFVKTPHQTKESAERVAERALNYFILTSLMFFGACFMAYR